MVEVVIAFLLLMICAAMFAQSMKVASSLQLKAIDLRNQIGTIEAALYEDSGEALKTLRFKITGAGFPQNMDMKIFVNSIIINGNELPIIIPKNAG